MDSRREPSSKEMASSPVGEKHLCSSLFTDAGISTDFSIRQLLKAFIGIAVSLLPSPKARLCKEVQQKKDSLPISDTLAGIWTLWMELEENPLLEIVCSPSGNWISFTLL